MKNRKAEIKRETAETKISLKIDLDSIETEKNKIDTGCGFLNHMLTLTAAHGGFRLDVKAQGDIDVDYHHTVEDVGIAFGMALKQAIGDKKGIGRYGDIILPMDEALMICAMDISGRDFLGYDVSFPSERVGDFDLELIKEFFYGFVRNADVTLHFKMLSGENSHHIGESMFKAFGRVISQAVSVDESKSKKIPSTKGVL